MLDLLDWDKEKFIKVDEKEDRYEIQMRFVLEKELQKKEKRKMHIQWRNSIKVFPNIET